MLMLSPVFLLQLPVCDTFREYLPFTFALWLYTLQRIKISLETQGIEPITPSMKRNNVTTELSHIQKFLAEISNVFQ